MDSSEILYQRGEDDGSDAWDDSALIKAYDDAISVMKAKLVTDNPDLMSTQSSSKGKKKKKSKSKKKQSSVQRWKSGDRCQAVYTEDGEVYEARIMSIDQTHGLCTVQYIGYGNEEEQLLLDLLPPGSGASSHKTDSASETESLTQTPQVTHSAQRSRSKKSTGGSRQNGGFPQWMGDHSAFSQMPPPPPPPHPFSHMPPPPHYGRMPQPPMFPTIPPPPPLFSQASGTEDDNEVLYSMLISWYMSGYHTGYYQGLRQAPGASSGHKVSR